MMIEMECGHWLDYEHWKKREDDHNIETAIYKLEIKALREKLSAIREVINGTNLPNRGYWGLAYQQALAMRDSRYQGYQGYQGYLGVNTAPSSLFGYLP